MGVALHNDIGAYPEGESKKVIEALSSPQFARFAKYVEDLKARPSFKKTWDEVSSLQENIGVVLMRSVTQEYITKAYKERFASLRQQK
jgi:glutathione S-transferase